MDDVSKMPVVDNYITKFCINITGKENSLPVSFSERGILCFQKYFGSKKLTTEYTQEISNDQRPLFFVLLLILPTSKKVHSYSFFI